jgi:hypothetical protein
MKKSKRNRLPGRIGKAELALLIGSILFAYLPAEPVFQLLVAPNLALNKQEFLSKEARILAQSSKRGATPRPGYVGLIGDSHALGLGDWLAEADKSGNPPFHSAHLLHRATGRDVVTFGRGGAGSIDGLVVEPVKKIAFLDGLLLFRMPRPGVGLIYFYEGNDLNDNLGVLERHFRDRYDWDNIRDPAYFRAFLDALAADARAETGFADNFMLAGFLFEVVDTYVNVAIKSVKRSVLGPEEEGPRPDFVTRARIGGEVRELPPFLQGPALGLDDERLELSLFVFEQCLAWLDDYLGTARKAVIYIPSPLGVYDVVSQKVHAQAYRKRRHVYSAEAVSRRSERIAASVREAAEDLGMAFVDTRAHLREAAKRRALHGPGDWRHFNRAGYEAFTRIMLDGLDFLQDPQSLVLPASKE